MAGMLTSLLYDHNGAAGGVSIHPFCIALLEGDVSDTISVKANFPEQNYDRNETLHPSDRDLLEKNHDRNEAQMASDPVWLKNCVSSRES